MILGVKPWAKVGGILELKKQSLERPKWLYVQVPERKQETERSDKANKLPKVT